MTSLSLFPRALALSAYSAVSGSRMTLCLAISCSALFACRSPPLLSLCLTVLPLEAGMGQAPHIAANDASERSLPGLSPAATASLAALTGPHPYIASSAAAFLALGEDGLATLMWTVPGGARETGGPYMRDPRHPRHFTDEFKRQIVDLYNAGKPKREIMDEYDLGKSTVERWIKSINATGSPRAADNRTPEQNRILELERENRRLRMEVDVLKQAALIYARK